MAAAARRALPDRRPGVHRTSTAGRFPPSRPLADRNFVGRVVDLVQSSRPGVHGPCPGSASNRRGRFRVLPLSSRIAPSLRAQHVSCEAEFGRISRLWIRRRRSLRSAHTRNPARASPGGRPESGRRWPPRCRPAPADQACSASGLAGTRGRGSGPVTHSGPERASGSPRLPCSSGSRAGIRAILHFPGLPGRRGWLRPGIQVVDRFRACPVPHDHEQFTCRWPGRKRADRPVAAGNQYDMIPADYGTGPLGPLTFSDGLRDSSDDRTCIEVVGIA